MSGIVIPSQRSVDRARYMGMSQEELNAHLEQSHKEMDEMIIKQNPEKYEGADGNFFKLKTDDKDVTVSEIVTASDPFNILYPAQEWEVQPMYDNILVLPDETPTEISGIILADNARDSMKPATGTVVAVGEGGYPISSSSPRPMEFEVGDRIYYNSVGQNTLLHGRHKYLIVKDLQVIAKLKRRENGTK